MHIIYMDDSRDEKLCVFSALAIKDECWRESFQVIRDFRRDLKKRFGIFVYKEIHAWKLVSGRGMISDQIVTKYQRNQIFREILELITNLPSARLFNAVGSAKDDERIFERMLNRIERTSQPDNWNSYFILFCDEGKEATYTRLSRKMAVYNPIPSKYGGWGDDGSPSKNIPIQRILEDPVFKKSDQSYFIQLVDCCAYALLRRERPIPSRSKYGLEKAFSILDPILVKEASSYDPEGIIRVD